MESFREPNFPLITDILGWLVKNYDQTFELSHDTSTEEERVAFVKSIATYLTSKAQININTKKLYMADGYAVKEIMKVVQVLYKAKTIPEHGSDDSQYILDINSKIGKLRECRNMASTITEKGVELYDLLGQELTARETRTNVISKPFELASMEKSVNQSISKAKDQTELLRKNLEGLKADEVNLQSKIEKKMVELERAEKRLKSLQGVR